MPATSRGRIAGPVLTGLAYAAPAYLLSTGATTAAERITGHDLPTWLRGAVIAAVLVVAILGVRGARAVPPWLGWVSLVLLLTLPLGLIGAPDRWPGVVVVALALLALVARLPRKADTGGFVGGTAGSPGTAVAPGPLLASPGRPSAQPGGLPQRPRYAAPVAVPLIGPRTRLVFLGCAAVGLLLGGALLWTRLSGSSLLGEAPAWLVWFPGVGLTVLGLLFLAEAVLLRQSHLVVDGQGVRRLGRGVAWDVPWSEVAQVGLRVRDATSVTGPTTRPARRRQVYLVLAPAAGGFAPAPDRERLELFGRDGRFGAFTLADRLPDLPLADGTRPVDRVATALAATVPDLYVGVHTD